MADVPSGTNPVLALPSADAPSCVSAVASLPAIGSILDVICRITGVKAVAVARVTESRWIACAVQDHAGWGLRPGGELDIATTLCREVRRQCQPIVIDNVAADAMFCDHPTPKLYKFRSFISVPVLLPDGTFFGTLCGLDPEPKPLDTPPIREMFKLFGELIAFHLDAHAKVLSSQADLRRERNVAELREQFIAVLGHDLRNPLAAITAGARKLQRSPADRELVSGYIVQAAGRMARLIENVLDFARGRLGGGLTLAVSAEPLEPVLRQILSETQTSSPDRVVRVDVSLSEPVLCDAPRIGQLFSNLLGNAITYGAPDQPIRVGARVTGGMLELFVANGGEPIAPEAVSELFHPYFRGKHGLRQHGLGLGLYIAAEIARAHGGTLGVQSDARETRFTFRMPVGA